METGGGKVKKVYVKDHEKSDRHDSPTLAPNLPYPKAPWWGDMEP